MRRQFLLLGLLGCQGGSYDIAAPDLELTVRSPTYGAFTGDEDVVRVEGWVNDPAALVWVEGRQANVGEDGGFSVELPVPGAYRVVDVEAANPKGHLRERLPVFSGHDPMETWPGALGARVTPLGLLALGESLEPTLEDLGLIDTIFGVLPTIDLGGFVFAPVATDSGDLEVALTPAAEGLDLAVIITGIELQADVEIPLLGADTLTLGLDEIAIGIEVQPEVDASGMLWLAFGDSTLSLAGLTLETSTLDPVILEDLLGGALAGLGPLAEGALDALLGGIGALPLGGPFAFEFDLLGTPLAVGIDALYGDLDGLALVLGLDLGGAGNGAGVEAPRGADGHPMSHVVLALHDGVFQPLLQSDLLDLLGQDLQLGGLLGNVLALPITSLSGGSGAPTDATGWCLGIDPGEARLARVGSDPDELLVIYLPDFRFDIGVQKGGTTTCWDWLDASVALELGIGLGADGALSLDPRLGEGAVLGYATTAPYEEQEVIAGLGALLDLAMGFLGGDLLGGLSLEGLLGTGTGLPLGELRVLEVRQVHDATGADVDGLKTLSLRIF